MKTEIILAYLAELEKNNSREWYHASKKQLSEATLAFEELLEALIVRLGQTEPELLNLTPKSLTFKLVRDTRFSKDKSPYNPVFRAHIGPLGKLPIPVGYYISLQPGSRSFLGGGLFTDMFSDATSMIRDAISARGVLFEKIINDPAFTAVFTVRGEKLKNIPGGYDRNHPLGEYLKHKSWYLEYDLPDGLLLDSELMISEAVRLFQLMRPFNAFLNEALKDFKMPAR
jgi:uncharacterized protein (TIGR02453 family)